MEIIVQSIVHIQRCNQPLPNQINQLDTILTEITDIERYRIGNSNSLMTLFMNREHTCGSLRIYDEGKSVNLIGWTERISRKFVDLHDGHGFTQIVVGNIDMFSKLGSTTDNDMLFVRGLVVARPQTKFGHSNVTGEIEVIAAEIKILSPSDESFSENRYANEFDGRNNGKEESTIDISKHCPADLPRANQYANRTHNCGQLSQEDIGKEVLVSGWLHCARIKRFGVLRDAYGQVQIMIPDSVSCPKYQRSSSAYYSLCHYLKNKFKPSDVRFCQHYCHSIGINFKSARNRCTATESHTK